MNYMSQFSAIHEQDLRLHSLEPRPAELRVQSSLPQSPVPLDGLDMTTGECCHLPGSLCDCTGNAALSKSVEDSESCRTQYVTQVTTKDGRLLSTVIKALGTQSDGPICRICHEGGNSEVLLSPCDCTGTLGTVHKSCLEKWLSSSNTSYCELCHTEFTIERAGQGPSQSVYNCCKRWIRDPGPANEKRTLCCDMVCFLFITPLAAVSGWLCLRGAQNHLLYNSRLEAVSLIALTIALFTIYVLWNLVSFRYHCQLYSEWRRTNQKVRLLIPDAKGSASTQHIFLSTKLLKKTSDETIV
ncbi:E3 ubiquitin-protein ligase MARCH2 [Bagarius yarrelli]|uniref:E3 ubiquitin-protein ligase MARCHF2 n=1 Tax=Bagarius yarrelli TaxID=175774 RepID=A0A556TS34_BAGYA|nr:E3 ubiquitin-protein ligase MARCH2 [Bagarius yarrelli]